MAGEKLHDEGVTAYVTTLVARARRALTSLRDVTQEEVDDLCARVAWQGCRDEFAVAIARLAVNETGLGTYDAKYAKMMKLKAVLADMKGVRTIGVIERDVEPGIVRIAKPVGVIGALIPVTNPEMTPFIKALWSLKTGNAIILAPHPRAAKVNDLAALAIRRTLAAAGFPEDLVIAVESPGLAVSQELLRQCDISLATGGAGMVQAAYSSGKPAYGVGVGNAYSIVDDTVDLAHTAEMIMRSKTFDNASGCSADNGVLIQDSIYPEMIRELSSVGGFLIRAGSKERDQLRSTMWGDDGQLSRAIVAKDAGTIAKLAQIPIPISTRFLMVEEEGIGPAYPFTREKLSPVLTLMRWSRFSEAVEMVNAITDFCGSGHSCAIHSSDESRVMELAARVRVARVTVRQPHGLSNSGAWTNGLRPTCTLGCGTWGGNIVSENVNFRHLMNITRVAYEIPSQQPDDLDLFGADVLREPDHCSYD